MSAPFTRSAAEAWMLMWRDEHADPHTGEVDCTALAEACAGAFDVADEGGPLDDETHWIWDIAVKVSA